MNFVDVTEKNDFEIRPFYKHLSTWRMAGEVSDIPNAPQFFLDVLKSGHHQKYMDEEGFHLEIDLPFLWYGTFARGDWDEWKTRADFLEEYISTFRSMYPDKFLSWYNLGSWPYISGYSSPFTRQESIEYEGFYGSLAHVFKPLDACLMSAYYSPKMEQENGIASYNVSCQWRLKLFEKQGIEVIPVIMPRIAIHDRFLTEYEIEAMLSFWEGKVDRIGLWNHPTDPLEQSKFF